MLSAVEEMALWTRQRIEAIRELMDATAERCRSAELACYKWELIELIFRQPYCKIEFVIEAGLAKRLTASRYLKELADFGILTVERIGREAIYRNTAFFDLLQRA